MVTESELPWAHKWEPFCDREGIDDGAEAFFRVLEDARYGGDEASVDCTSVLYVCLGLGFVGTERGRPAKLRELMSELSSSLRHMMDSDRGSRIVPEAYEHIDTSDLVQPPARGLIGIAIALVVMVVVVLAGNLYFFQSASAELSDQLIKIRDRAQGPDAGNGGSQ